MSPAILPFEVDGATARLHPSAHRSFALGPGQLGRNGAAAIALWNASDAIHQQDLFAAFWAYDADQIDWLTGYLCDQTITDWFDQLANPPEPEEEPEELFARASMNTLESTVDDGR